MNDPQTSDLFYTALALIWGIARELQNFLEKKQITWKTVFARAFVAAFTGVMFSHSIGYFFPDLAILASGLGGWMWPGAMEFIETLIRKKLDYDKQI